jgi:membrane-associated phospholipid phosphatase
MTPPVVSDDTNADANGWRLRSSGYSPIAPWANSAHAALSLPFNRFLRAMSPEKVADLFLIKMAASNPVVIDLPLASEIAVLWDYKTHRCADQEKEIKDQVQVAQISGALCSAIGRTDWPSPVYYLMIDALRDLLPIIAITKLRYNRIRPYQIFPELAPGFLTGPDFPKHPSFPSGHSSQAHLIAELIKLIWSDGNIHAKADACAAEIARNRERAGLHFPTDSAAGAALARFFVAELLQDQIFQQDLDSAKQEIGNQTSSGLE